MTAAPLTLGTAGHIDHGKTALVGRLTGVDTDRLPEEKARGISIALGYAPLVLPSRRALSVVDVPGHERFVRTMVAGASGIDLFLLVVAADDGVMPQTVEHAAVLRALGVDAGVVAITRSDLADPAEASAQAAELVPGVPVVACSARTGDGIDELAATLDRVVAGVAPRPLDGPPLLHVDRAFTLPGAGVVVTGTLWSGSVGRGDVLPLRGDTVRVRSVQVHDVPVGRAEAGQRVAVALTGARLRDVARGDVLGDVAETTVLDCALDLREDARHGERVQVHHGTRDVAGRIGHLDDDLWQVRCEAPLAARDGDRIVVRRQSPPDTLGGGVVIDASARRHGRRPDLLDALRRRRDGVPEPTPPPVNVQPLVPETSARTFTPSEEEERAEEQLRASGLTLLTEEQVGVSLRGLRDAGRAVRISGLLYAHADTAARVRGRVRELIERDGDVTLAGLRDDLGTSRKNAQAFLEHCDAEKLTRRLPDDRRVLRRARAAT